MFDIVRRETIYLWYYFSLQLEQIFGYWVLGMVLGSIISVFVKDRIHGLFRSMHRKRLGVLGIIAASALGIASPLCMYGTIPLAASFSDSRVEDDWLAAFMMSSMLWRYARSPATTDKELRFTDANQASSYALDALRLAVENDILSGYGDGRLGPQRLATCAQVAQMLKNFLGK